MRNDISKILRKSCKTRQRIADVGQTSSVTAWSVWIAVRCFKMSIFSVNFLNSDNQQMFKQQIIYFGKPQKTG